MRLPHLKAACQTKLRRHQLGLPLLAQVQQYGSEPRRRRDIAAADVAAQLGQGVRGTTGGHRRSPQAPRATRGWTAFTAYGLEARDIVRAENPGANAADIEKVGNFHFRFRSQVKRVVCARRQSFDVFMAQGIRESRAGILVFSAVPSDTKLAV